MGSCRPAGTAARWWTGTRTRPTRPGSPAGTRPRHRLPRPDRPDRQGRRAVGLRGGPHADRHLVRGRLADHRRPHPAHRTPEVPGRVPAGPDLADADEFLSVVRGVWRGEPYDFHGEHYQVDGGLTAPAPDRYRSSSSVGPPRRRGRSWPRPRRRRSGAASRWGSSGCSPCTAVLGAGGQPCRGGLGAPPTPVQGGGGGSRSRGVPRVAPRGRSAPPRQLVGA